MVRINKQDYLIAYRGMNSERLIDSVRNFWLVRDKNTCGLVEIGKIYFPKDMVGKRVRFKVEVIDW